MTDPLTTKSAIVRWLSHNDPSIEKQLNRCDLYPKPDGLTIDCPAVALDDLIEVCRLLLSDNRLQLREINICTEGEIISCITPLIVSFYPRSLEPLSD